MSLHNGVNKNTEITDENFKKERSLYRPFCHTLSSLCRLRKITIYFVLYMCLKIHFKKNKGILNEALGQLLEHVGGKKAGYKGFL